MDTTKSHQQRRGSLSTNFSAQTLWSSENGSSNNKYDKDKGVNVQVLLRCRPMNEDEVRAKTPAAISCNELRREVTVIQNMGSKQIDRTFVFDKVFGPASKQKDLYDQAIAPIVNEALEGYNCTVFAYGQTGTGKTYTMEGEGEKEKNRIFHRDAGVIPRAVQQIFDTLEDLDAEYIMKVTFIELYNEEITDLLGPDESKFSDDKSKKPIALLEDGKGAVFMRGLEEEIVCSAEDIYKILEKGSARKHTAETLLNKQSNRSHSLFTITVQIKECTSEGVELIKCGKLNLVDLAGSENILRSGAREGRAREAGEINKSLLTLGRVINALVEHSGHVPYRDSKLTRLLRDSLGGKTKTCIIATVSPSIHCLEESLSTLDYAYRAKNIKNRPEVNQKVIKSAVIKDLYTKIDRLKQDLHATREKNGIYVARDRYLSEEAAKKAMAEKLRRMELDSKFKDKQLLELQELYLYQQQLTAELSGKFESIERQLKQSEKYLSDLEDKNKQANETIKEKEYLIFNLLGSEKALTERAYELHAELENAASEVSGLFAKIEQKRSIEDGNKDLIQNFHTQLVQQLDALHEAVASAVTEQKKQLKVIEENTQLFLSRKDRATEELQKKIIKLNDMYQCTIKSLVDLAGEGDGTYQFTFGNVASEVSKHSFTLSELFREISLEADPILDTLQKNLNNQAQSIIEFAQHQHESHSRTYQGTQSISKIMVKFFKTLSATISKLTVVVEEAQRTNDDKLCGLEKKFEEYADNEERQLLDKMAELLASSNARKKKLVQAAVGDLRDCTTSRSSKLQQEVSNIQDFSSLAQGEWIVYVENADKHYTEDITAVESGKNGLEGDLRNCMAKARLATEQWRRIEESVVSLQRRHINAVDAIVQGGVEANQVIHARLCSVASSTSEAADRANKDSLSSIEYLQTLDHKETEKTSSLTGPCHKHMREMESAHSDKVVMIIENAEKCLIHDYKVDESLCSTLRKRSTSLPASAIAIEELKTPAFEELLKSYRGNESGKKANGDVNISSGLQE